MKNVGIRFNICWQHCSLVTNEMKWKETSYRPDVCHWELFWKNWDIVLSDTVWLKLTNSWPMALLTFFPKRLFPKILLRSEVQWFQQYCLHNSIGHLNGYRVEHPNQLFFSKILSAKIKNVFQVVNRWQF